MDRIARSLFLAWLSGGAAAAQGTAFLTNIGHLGLQPVPIVVPALYSTRMKSGIMVNLPPGFKVNLFYKGSLSGARFMAFGPDSVMYVANQSSGQVIALPDRNRDGVADTAIVAATGLGAIHDVKFFRGAMYATSAKQVFRLTSSAANSVYDLRSVFIDSIASLAQNPNGGHQTRTIVFDSANGRIFLSVGSSCNVCRDSGRADIEVRDMDGKNPRLYATGVRNAVGLALNPVTGRLWADNNGPDNQGDNIPPEWIDLVREHGFYGWPFAYGFQKYFDFTVTEYASVLPITSDDSARVRAMVAPAAQIQAHSAPLGIDFATPAFPAPYSKGAFMALHGSWNRTIATGYKVVFLALTNAQDTVVDSVFDFLTGFVKDSVQKSEWARPVGILPDQGGNLFVSSDADSQFILRISPDPTVYLGARWQVAPSLGLEKTGPRSWRIAVAGSAGPLALSVFDVSGRKVAAQAGSAASIAWTAPPGLSGIYWISVQEGSRRLTQRVGIFE